MGLFGKRGQQQRGNNDGTETAIAVISARLTFLQTLTSHLVAELPARKRDLLLEQLRDAIGGLMLLPPPVWVPPAGEQDYRDELRRDMELLIEKAANLAKPMNR